MKARRSDKEIVIVAGPNGAGKTTFAASFLIQEKGFGAYINADPIAQGLSVDPVKSAITAGKMMLNQIEQHAARGESFAFETTLSGTNYARRIPRWQQLGFRVTLLFLSLPTEDVAVARVKERVAQNGHHVPEETVRRRFHAGLRNFRDFYCKVVDRWMFCDNSGVFPLVLESGANL